jgi:DNA-binding XRE family transcriptional regulator
MAGRERLGARRKALGLTQESLAERLRVERSTVARWEQGTATPRPWYRRRLAEALDLTPDELARMLCPLPESRAAGRGPAGRRHGHRPGRDRSPGGGGVPSPACPILGSAAGSSQDPDWTWWVDQAELSWHRAMTLLSLGDRDAALDLFRTAYELRAPEARRSRLNDLAHLLAAQVSVGAWPDAVDSLDRLTAEVDGIRSGRTDALLRRVVRRIGDHRPPAPSAATDAAEHLTRRLDRSH